MTATPPAQSPRNPPLPPPRAVRRIAASWRSLSGGRRTRDLERRTLVACSGGADSSALLIALAAAAAPGTIVAAHVVHDMRTAAAAHADRDGTKELARSLKIPFVEAEIQARPETGNLEASSRRLRYAALAALARGAQCPLVATGHHADDQLETVLMRLLRGAGPAGLAGISARRSIDRISPKVTLIRPMLGITREACEEICRSAGWTWREDETNQDAGHLRAALRLRVTPVLRELNPAAAMHAVSAASLCKEAWGQVRRAAQEVIDGADTAQGCVQFSREALRACPRVVAAEAVRRAIIQVGPPEVADRITRRSVLAAIRAARDSSGESRQFGWRGVGLEISRERVRVFPRTAAQDGV